MARTRTEILKESADLNFRLAKDPQATPDERELFLGKVAEDMTLAHFIRQDRRMN